MSLDESSILCPVLEPPVATEPAQAAQTPPKRAFPKPLSIDREAVKALSMAGMSDPELISRFPHLPSGTLKKWRQRDPVWAAVFKATRRPETLVSAAAAAAAGLSLDLSPVSQVPVADAQAAVSAEIVKKAAGDSLLDIHNATALSLVKASGEKLQEFSQKPAQIESWQDAATAYKLQRLAAGIDREGTQVSLNLTMFADNPVLEQGECWEAEAVQCEEVPYEDAE